MALLAYILRPSMGISLRLSETLTEPDTGTDTDTDTDTDAIAAQRGIVALSIGSRERDNWLFPPHNGWEVGGNPHHLSSPLFRLYGISDIPVVDIAPVWAIIVVPIAPIWAIIAVGSRLAAVRSCSCITPANSRLKYVTSLPFRRCNRDLRCEPRQPSLPILAHFGRGQGDMSLSVTIHRGPRMPGQQRGGYWGPCALNLPIDLMSAHAPKSGKVALGLHANSNAADTRLAALRHAPPLDLRLSKSVTLPPSRTPFVRLRIVRFLPATDHMGPTRAGDNKEYRDLSSQIFKLVQKMERRPTEKTVGTNIYKRVWRSGPKHRAHSMKPKGQNRGSYNALQRSSATFRSTFSELGVFVPSLAIVIDANISPQPVDLATNSSRFENLKDGYGKAGRISFTPSATDAHRRRRQTRAYTSPTHVLVEFERRGDAARKPASIHPGFSKLFLRADEPGSAHTHQAQERKTHLSKLNLKVDDAAPTSTRISALYLPFSVHNHHFPPPPPRYPHPYPPSPNSNPGAPTTPQPRCNPYPCLRTRDRTLRGTRTPVDTASLTPKTFDREAYGHQTRRTRNQEEGAGTQWRRKIMPTRSNLEGNRPTELPGRRDDLPPPFTGQKSPLPKDHKRSHCQPTAPPICRRRPAKIHRPLVLIHNSTHRDNLHLKHNVSLHLHLEVEVDPGDHWIRGRYPILTRAQRVRCGKEGGSEQEGGREGGGTGRECGEKRDRDAMEGRDGRSDGRQGQRRGGKNVNTNTFRARAMEFIGNGERGGRPIYEGVEVSPRAQECGEAAGNSTGPGVDEGRWTWRQHRGLGEEGHDTCGVTNGREPMVQGKPYRLKKTVSTNIRSFLVTISRVREVGEKREGVMYSFEVSNTPPVFLKSPATDKGPGFALAVFGPVGCTIDARRPKAYGRGNMPRGASVHTRRFQKQHWLEYRYESGEAAWAPRRQTYRQGSAAAAPDARIDLGRLTLTLFPEAQRIPLTQENPSIVRVPSRLCAYIAEQGSPHQNANTQRGTLPPRLRGGDVTS
ncbi:hypothetical protein FA13DRAFT_1722820 [Coprinellus micaceus]|uniref:Uncharacterized protein n=1 Tax=Coprinellus micaceus TaxID=71717 RepID=A0A4Y7RIR3_COPMI|nr:hypothetical protein FA13DRAFT_1722820 [Coprinellus micaceus]